MRLKEGSLAWSSHISRRRFVGSACAFGVGMHLSNGYAQKTSEEVIVATPLGRLRGVQREGVRVFRGIPFAAPPVGPLRFRPTEPAAAWTGVRDALDFAPAAMQAGRSERGCSEDCLYLNVWTPTKTGPHPVLVWIHGGGFEEGASSDPMSRGGAFTQDGIVVVTVAYRLGVFGFLDMGPLLGSSYAGSADNGLHDLLAALKWVKENIADFGGDPERVTIAGESAGAKLTDILLGTPTAQKLFQSAISESGGAERVASHAAADSVAEGFGAAFQTLGGHETHAIGGAEAEVLIAAQQRFLKDWPEHFPLRPEVDGQLLTAFPIENLRQGCARGKRLLIGTNREESAFFLGPKPESDPDAEQLGNVSVSRFDKVAAQYAKLYPEMTVEERRVRSTTAEEYWIPSVRVAEAQCAYGPTWMYRLDYTRATGRFAGEAYHTEELGLVWNRLSATAPEEEKRLAGRVHEAWVAFLKGRVPAAEGLPVWPQYNVTSRQTMLLDAVSHVEGDPAGPERRLWQGTL